MVTEMLEKAEPEMSTERKPERKTAPSNGGSLSEMKMEASEKEVLRRAKMEWP